MFDEPPIPVGTRGVTNKHTHPYGAGVVTKSDRWIVVVRLDADGVEYLFGVSAVRREVAA